MRDLFGDLPSTKKSAPASLLFGDLPGPKKDVSSSVNPAIFESSLANEAQVIAEVDASLASMNSSLPSVADLNHSTSTKNTSMSFVPAALRKRPMPTAHKPATHVLKPTTIISQSKSNMPQSDVDDSTVPDLAANSKITATGDSNEEIYIESEQLLSLHDQLAQSDGHDVEIYDPRQPNDYLWVLQQRQQASYKKYLELQAKEFMERQAALQRQIDEERKRIDQSGDYNAMIASRTTSRGRGQRNVQNLPAWLVKKQMEQQQQQQQQEEEDVTDNETTLPNLRP